MNKKDLRKLKTIVENIEDRVREGTGNVWMRKQASRESQETACQERIIQAYENCKEMVLKEFPDVLKKEEK